MINHRPIQSFLQWLAILSGTVVLTSCTGLPKRSSDQGVLTLGMPDVHRRERHITDRFADIAWLQRQLNEPNMQKYAQGLQGARTTAVLDQIAAGLSVTYSPAAGLLQPPEEKVVTPEGSTETPASGTPDSDTTPPSEPEQVADDTPSDDKADTNPVPPSGKPSLPYTSIKDALDVLDRIAITETVAPTPIERLDDLLGFRDSVRSEIRQRSLDDTHDVDGNTLYELTFELSYLPGEDSGWPVVAMCNISQPTTPDGPSVSAAFAQSVAVRVQQLAHAELTRRLRRVRSSPPAVLDQGWWTEARYIAAKMAREAVDGLANDGSPIPMTFVEPDDGWDSALSNLDESTRKFARTGESDQGDFKQQFENAAFDAFLPAAIAVGFREENTRTATSQGHSAWPVTLVIPPSVGDIRAIQITVDKTEVKRRLDQNLQDSNARIVEVLPREMNERLSMRGKSLVARTLSVAASGNLSSSVAASAELESLREELTAINTVEGAPVLIGFNHGPGFKSGASPKGTQSFGWLIGPSYEGRQPSRGGLKHWYRHPGVNHSVSATLIAPVSLPSVDITVEAYRLNRHGKLEPLTSQPVVRSVSMSVPLPQDTSAGARSVIHDLGRKHLVPRVTPSREESPYWTLRAGETGEIVLLGENLWRNPRVYLSGTPADEVEILPSIEGLRAKWNKVPLPAEEDPKGIPVELVVASSAGQDQFPKGVRVLPARKSKPVPNVSVKVSPKTVVVSNDDLRLPIQLNAQPEKGHAIRVELWDTNRAATAPLAVDTISQFGSRYFDTATKTLDARLTLPSLIGPEEARDRIVRAKVVDDRGNELKSILDARVTLYGTDVAKPVLSGSYTYDGAKILNGKVILDWGPSATLSWSQLSTLVTKLDTVKIIWSGRPLQILSVGRRISGTGHLEQEVVLKPDQAAQNPGAGPHTVSVIIGTDTFAASLTKVP